MKPFPFKTSYPTRAEAKTAALAMRAMLKKPNGWKPRLHCSEPRPEHRHLGVWYAGLINGSMTLSCHVHKGVATFMPLLAISSSWAGCGEPMWGVGTSYRSPDAAIAAQVKGAQKVFAKMREVEAHITPFLSTV